MNEPTDSIAYNRRDFLKGSSVTALMTMLGGVELFGQTNSQPAGENQVKAPVVKVALIGMGTWGREILNALNRLEMANVVAICDSYPAALKRSTSNAPNAKQTPDYKSLLENKDIRAVIVATPTHLHKEIVLAALKAGKHVYCEAPIAHTLEDAKEIALAAKAARQLVFQSGLQLRSDKERQFLVPFIRSGAIGQFLMARSQWHRKTSWRAPAANADREKAVNWRLDKDLSLGLIGEAACHQIDQANWFFNSRPVSVTAFGSLLVYTDDGRQVPDMVQAVFEYAGGYRLILDATLGNSFDGAYDMYYGSFAAIMVRQDKAWLFKEVDSPLLGWEIYARKDIFYKETGIALVANASKSVQPTENPEAQAAPEFTILSRALEIFLRNAGEVDAATEDYINNFGADDKAALVENAAKIQRRPAAGFLEGYHSAVTVIKANEAITSGKKVSLPKELYELS